MGFIVNPYFVLHNCVSCSNLVQTTSSADLNNIRCLKCINYEVANKVKCDLEFKKQIESHIKNIRSRKWNIKISED
jgi:hypothetical protein